MVLQHWDLERQLTNELLATIKENRWEIFEKCYTTLYHDLAWLNKLVHGRINISPEIRYKTWVDVIGSSLKKFMKLVQGKGDYGIIFIFDRTHM